MNELLILSVLILTSIISVSEENFPVERSVSRGPIALPVDADQDIYVDVNVQHGASSRPISGASGLTPHSQNSRPAGQTVEHDDGIYNQIGSPSSGHLDAMASGMAPSQGDGYYELDSSITIIFWERLMSVFCLKFADWTHGVKAFRESEIGSLMIFWICNFRTRFCFVTFMYAPFIYGTA